jgi:protein-tyrosine phosphatase
VLRQKLIPQNSTDKVYVASAATHDLNTGETIDYHAQKHALRRDYDLSGMRSRLFETEDFARFDLILAMDEGNLQTLRLRCPPAYQEKLRLFTDYCSTPVGHDVPDPYYGHPDDFENVLNIIEDGCDGVLNYVDEKVNSRK